jgi:hypothetical protein
MKIEKLKELLISEKFLIKRMKEEPIHNPFETEEEELRWQMVLTDRLCEVERLLALLSIEGNFPKVLKEYRMSFPW